MTTVAVVPVQRLSTAKSRLAERLNPDERRVLVLSLLDHVLATLNAARHVDAVILVSPDLEVLDRAARHGAVPLLQPGSGLNEGLRLGRDEAVRRGADTLLIVLADLPWVTADEIDALVAALPERGVALAPDRHEHGTNAAALRPPDAIEPAFGAGSFARHQAQAVARGLPLQELRVRGLAFDIDTPADLEELAGHATVSASSDESGT
ncbi:2-phospho-L-lactate guanylyltransferase [Sphaerobacter sp.]|uniref:2-phospho-L-lactate guanylyltransferase n=1 Tax=Sphaerobacter sp. TaxID=2099654 RepID=UPI001D69AC92|nr:2-phospho-L-lactate guanylyltransferase [Sphaerobacter sp.]MBX5445346.1 2-phospho-L-lactate guanylyltransferase [Sphaerobacter sp.]